jgi:hypothetical protein
LVCCVAHAHSVLDLEGVVSLNGLLSNGHSFSNLIAVVQFAILVTASSVSCDSFCVHFVAINLDNSFFWYHASDLKAFAIYVFDFVENTSDQSTDHTRKLPIFHSVVFQSNGHAPIPANPHTVHLENTDNISLATSALSFLEIASDIHLAMLISLFNIFTLGNHSFSATSSIYFLISLLIFLNHSAAIPEASSQLLV